MDFLLPPGTAAPLSSHRTNVWRNDRTSSDSLFTSTHTPRAPGPLTRTHARRPARSPGSPARGSPRCPGWSRSPAAQIRSPARTPARTPTCTQPPAGRVCSQSTGAPGSAAVTSACAARPSARRRSRSHRAARHTWVGGFLGYGGGKPGSRPRRAFALGSEASNEISTLSSFALVNLRNKILSAQSRRITVMVAGWTWCGLSGDLWRWGRCPPSPPPHERKDLAPKVT